MSSAILYVAIVAIWAGVLIPRWLRRDSAASGRNSEGVAAAEAKPSAEAEAEVGEEPTPAPALRRREGHAGSEARPAGPVYPARTAHRGERAVSRSAAAARPTPRAEARAEARPTPRPEIAAEVPHGEPRDHEHKKVMSARRRLLGMLLVLAIAAGVLAFTRMAAWWVVVPPSIMLLGYLALLYEAGRADAEGRKLARTRAAADAAARVAVAKRAAPPAPAAPAPAPDAEVIDIAAPLTVAGHKFYDQHADAKLRAVGDLAGRVTG